MGAALRFILILIIAWYVIRIIDRVIAPALFGSAKKENTSKSRDDKEFRKSTRQGEVTITDYSEHSKDVKPDDDDFVDYEEVE